MPKRKINVKRKKNTLKLSNLKFPITEYKAKEFGLSQSLITSYLQCDRNLLMALNRWRVPGKEENFFYGNVVHEVLDRCYSYYEEAPGEIEIEEEMNEYLDELEEKEKLHWITTQKLEYYKTVIVVVLTKYFEFNANDYDFEFEEVEGIFDVKWKGFRLTGKCDGKFKKKDGRKKKRVLFEHKTKGTINEANIELKLNLDFQNKFYMFCDYVRDGSWVDEVLYNIIRRPQLKVGSNETLSNFAERLDKDIESRPDFYFKRWEVKYTKKQMEDFQIELYEKLKYMEKLILGKRKTLCNESSCLGSFPCDNLKACSNDSLEGYFQETSISPELE